MQITAWKPNFLPVMARYCTGDASLLQRSAAHHDSLVPSNLRAPRCPQPAFPPLRPLFCLAAAPSTHLQRYNHSTHLYRYLLPFPPTQIHPHTSLPALQPTGIYLYNPSMPHVMKPLVRPAGTMYFQNMRCPSMPTPGGSLLSRVRAVTREQLSSHREDGEDGHCLEEG